MEVFSAFFSLVEDFAILFRLVPFTWQRLHLESKHSKFVMEVGHIFG